MCSPLLILVSFCPAEEPLCGSIMHDGVDSNSHFHSICVIYEDRLHVESFVRGVNQPIDRIT